MGLLHGRVGRLTATNGGFRPGQKRSWRSRGRPRRGRRSASQTRQRVPTRARHRRRLRGRTLWFGRPPSCRSSLLLHFRKCRRSDSSRGRSPPPPPPSASRRGGSRTITARRSPVRARPGRFSTLGASHSESVLYSAFAWARGALNGTKRRFLARADHRGVKDAKVERATNKRLATDKWGNKRPAAVHHRQATHLSGPARGGHAPFAFPIVNRVCAGATGA
jgi:hypothetical protein